MSDKPSSQEALLAKMDALVGRHRPAAAIDSDDIPVLTQIVGASPAPAIDMNPEPKPDATRADQHDPVSHEALRAAVAQEVAAMRPELQRVLEMKLQEMLEHEANRIAERVARKLGVGI